jgi:hypothetical protein
MVQDRCTIAAITAPVPIGTGLQSCPAQHVGEYHECVMMTNDRSNAIICSATTARRGRSGLRRWARQVRFSVWRD